MRALRGSLDTGNVQCGKVVWGVVPADCEPIEVLWVILPTGFCSGLELGMDIPHTHD